MQEVQTLRRHAAVVTATVLLTLALTAAIVVAQGARYRSQAELLVATGFLSGKFGALVKTPFQTQSQVLVTQARLASEPAVAARAAALLGGRFTPGEVADAVGVTAEEDANVVTVTAQAAHAGDARAIAAAYARAAAARARGLAVAEVRRAAQSVTAELAQNPPERRAARLRAELRQLDVLARGTTGGVQVTEAGSAPERADPAALPQLVLGAIVAVVLGIAAGLLADRLEGRLDEDELAHRTGWRVLGRLPVPAGGPPLSLSAPGGSAAEAARRAALLVDGAATAAGSRVLLVATASAGEGRTGGAAALAVALAETGRRVIIVDADLRDPRLWHTFGIPGVAPGLTDMLGGVVADLDDVLHEATPASATNGSLHVLPARPAGPLGLPSALLSGPQLSDTLAALRAECDYVVLDSAPLLEYGDALLLAREADAIVVLANGRRSTPARLEHARTALETATVPVLGVVVVDPLAARRAPAWRLLRSAGVERDRVRGIANVG